jgi:hypothetical protein
MRCTYKIVVGKPEGGDHFGKPRLRYEYNTKMDLKEI